MQKFKIVVAYDGTNFHGWQIQPVDETITSCLESVFFKVFKQNISLFGASRTDAGVHALGQVAQFHSDLSISEEQMCEAWNKSLPKTIFIRSLQRVSQEFHPCRNVKQKTYYYHLFLKRPLPFIARYGWFYRYIDKVDLEKFNLGLQLYVGEHDFASFCKMELDKSTIRTIDSISMKKNHRWSVICIEVKGKSFLHFQIRRMIGYALDVACRDSLPLDYLKGVLETKNPCQSLLKAAGSGLCLRKVVYNDIFDVFDE